jgi:hypothetical protein
MWLSMQVLLHHLVIPLVFLAWLAIERPPSRLRWLSTAFLVTGYLLFIVLVGAWGWVGYPLRITIPLLLPAALYLSFVRSRGVPLRAPRSWKASLETGFRAGLGALFAAMALVAIAGYRAPADAIELSFPLREGTYLVGHGGSTTLVNYHVSHPSQRYALDILRLNRFGTRANGLYPRTLNRYAIWGDTVRSPCTGAVVFARDGLPDLVPPATDRALPAGNTVAIECAGAVVYLAHLREGSVAVRTGQPVRAGDPLGTVGNSGNTSEPHLHIHAERGRYTGTPSGQPGVAIRFDRRFLVRNSLVRGG